MFKVWAKTRTLGSLEVVGTRMMHRSDSRIDAEMYIEKLQPVPAAPGFIVTVEMEMPQATAMRDVLDTTFAAEVSRAEELARVTNERDKLRDKYNSLVVDRDNLHNELVHLRAVFDKVNEQHAALAISLQSMRNALCS